MILNKSQRDVATTLFGKDPFAKLQAHLLNATVRVNNGAAWGSGVIFFCTATDAYVLTAKHVLHTLLSKTAEDVGTPADARTALLKVTPKLFYGPPKLLEPPKDTAPVVDIDFTGYADSGKTWTYDACVLRLRNDAKFLEHAKAYALISSGNLNDYVAGVKAPNTGMPFLNAKTYRFAQLGYGDSLDSLIPFTNDYPKYSQKIQFKESTPEAAVPQREVFSIERVEKPRVSYKFATHSNMCVLLTTSDDTSKDVRSTGTGDSGGPFLAIDKAKSVARLVGVTTGANYFYDEALKKTPDDRPDTKMWNNAATAVTSEFLDAWAPIIMTGYDVKVYQWGAGVPTTGRSLVIVGLDKDRELHIRVFDWSEVRTDVDKSNVPEPKKEAFAALEQRIQSVVEKRTWDLKVKTEIINAAIPIATQT